MKLKRRRKTDRRLDDKVWWNDSYGKITREFYLSQKRTNRKGKQKNEKWNAVINKPKSTSTATWKQLYDNWKERRKKPEPSWNFKREKVVSNKWMNHSSYHFSAAAAQCLHLFAINSLLFVHSVIHMCIENELMNFSVLLQINRINYNESANLNELNLA